MDPWAAAVLGAVVAVAVMLLGAAVLCCQCYRELDRRVFPRARLSALLLPGGLHTGDLVFFDSAAFSLVIKWTTRSPFSHVGVVVLVRGEPHLAEFVDPMSLYCRRAGVPARGARVAAGDGFALPGGVSLWPLARRLRDYPGRFFVARLSAPLAPPQRAALVRAALNETRGFARVADLLGSACGLWRPRTLHCFQFAARLLNAAGVPAVPLPATRPVAPVRLLSRADRLPLAGGRRYSVPAEIAYDI